jgi:hypothetical protein
MSAEKMLHVSLCEARQSIRQQYLRCEKRMRQSPMTTVLGSVAVGCLLHRLPVRAILFTHVRVLFALTPPALFLFGAAKLYDCMQRRELARQSAASTP